jgi:hypothetical protein
VSTLQATYKIITIASPEGDPLQRVSTSTSGSGRNTANSRSSLAGGRSTGDSGVSRRASAAAGAAAQQAGAQQDNPYTSFAGAAGPQPDASASAEPGGGEAFDPRSAVTPRLRSNRTPDSLQRPPA